MFQHSACTSVRTLATAGALALIGLAASPADAAGVLVPRDGRAPVNLRSQRVTAELDDGLARTTVRQAFVSPHAGALEAIYMFPVPEGATLVDVAMEVGGQRLEGLVVERQAARRIYNEIVRSQRDPALVEQVGRNTFRLSVFPVLPKEETIVELTWIEQAPLADGSYHYVYPLALAGDSTSTEQDLTFTLKIRSTAPLVEVASPTEGMDVIVKSPHEAIASFEQQRAKLDRDLVVNAAVRAPEASLGIRSYRTPDGHTVIAAVVTPPPAASEKAIPRDVTLLLDCSGSMKGEKMVQARNAALFLVDNAREIDRVNVVRFNAGVDAFADAPQPMDADNRAKLRAFVEASASGGGTALGDALDFAVKEAVTEGRLRTIVLLTDGRPTVGVTDATAIVGIARSAKAGRVFTFGVGADLHEGLLRGIASATRGKAEVFRPGGEIEGRLSTFLRRTSTPVLANVRLEADGARLIETYPRPIPDVYLGEQIVLTTRVRGDVPTTLRLRAQVGEEEIVLQAAVPARAAPGGDRTVLQTFGSRKIEFLEEALRLRQGLDDDAYYAALDRGAYSTSDEIVAEIVNTSIESGIQSAYASFLVLLPEDRHRIDPRNLEALNDARKRASEARREAAGDLAKPDDSTAKADTEKPGDKPEVEEREKGVDDPVIKDAKVSDHNETDRDMDGRDVAGTGLGDPRFNSDAPFEGPGNNGTIGIGGGAGGAFGGRRGGARNLRAGGGGKKTMSAVDHASEYLKRTQAADGSWPGQVGAEPGVTGTALLCFLGAGETHQSGQYKEQVKIGLRYLKSVQDAEGWFGPRTSEHALFNHVRGTLAMVEAYGLTGSRLFKDSADRAVRALRAHPDARTWWAGAGESEAGWIVLVAKSAAMSDVDDGSWIAEFVAEAPRVLDTTPHTTPAARDAALLALAMGGATDLADRVQKASFEAPTWSEGALDVEALQRRTLIAYQVGVPVWKPWSEALKTALVDTQTLGKDTEYTQGSWNIRPEVTARGIVHDSALCQLILEVYYRYGRVVGASTR